MIKKFVTYRIGNENISKKDLEILLTDIEGTLKEHFFEIPIQIKITNLGRDE